MIDPAPPHECIAALEKNMCEELLEVVKTFCADPRNMEKLKKWKAEQEKNRPAGGNLTERQRAPTAHH